MDSESNRHRPRLTIGRVRVIERTPRFDLLYVARNAAWQREQTRLNQIRAERPAPQRGA